MAAQAVHWGAFQAGNTSSVVKLDLWLNCYLIPRQKLKALPFCSPPWILQTDRPTWEAVSTRTVVHSQQPNLMLLQGSLDTQWVFFFKPPQHSEDASEMCKPPPCEESSAVITCHQKSPSPYVNLSPHWAIKFPPPL